MNMTSTIAASAAIAIATSMSAAGSIDLTMNGGFESGDTTGWVSFPSAGSTFNVTSDANSGNWGAELFNNTGASGAVIKQANLGVGLVNAGDMVNISFYAKGEGAAGGVAFAEFFSEIAGGGVSSSQLLGGAPLSLTSEYQLFSYDVLAGADVSGGITLQFAAVTGADSGSVSVLFLDDVSVSIVPAPASAMLLGLGGMVGMRRRR